MKTYKFFTGVREYNININFVPMFKVLTYAEVTQEDIDGWNEIIKIGRAHV